MIDPKELIAQFQNITNGVMKENENTGVVKFLRATVKTLEGVVAKIDAFLKSKNIDVGEKLEMLSGKVADAGVRGRAMLASAQEEIKSKGVIGAMKSGWSDAKTAVSEKFTSDTERSGAPPDSAQDPASPGSPAPANPPSVITILQNSISALAGSIEDLSKRAIPGFAPPPPTPQETQVGAQPVQTEEDATKESSKLLSKLQEIGTSIEGLYAKMSADGSSKPDGVDVSTSESSSAADYADSLTQSRERAERRAKEILEEKAAVKEKALRGAKPKGTNWFFKIFSAIGRIAPFIVGGLGKVLTAVVPALVSLTGKMVGGILTRLVPGLAGAIARGTGGIVKGALSMAGKGLWGGAKMLVTKGAPALWVGAKALGTGLATAIGATGLAIGGAVIGAGLLIYGGYKLYKYLNRNSVATDIFGQLTRLRLLMYGFNDAKKEHYYRIMELEMMMKDYVQLKDGRVSMVKFDAKFKDKVRELFEVKPAEKEKYTILNTWFARRFMPAFKSFLNAFMPLGPNLYLDNIDKLSNDQVFTLASKLIPPTSIYDVTQVPTFDDPAISVSSQEVDDMLAAIRTKAKTNSKALEGPGAQKTQEQVDKQTDTLATAAAAKAAQTTQAGIPVVTPPKSEAAVATVPQTPPPATTSVEPPPPATTSVEPPPPKVDSRTIVDGPSSQSAQRNSMNRLSIKPLIKTPSASSVPSTISPTPTAVTPPNLNLPASKIETPNQEGEAPVKDTPGKPPVPVPTAAPAEATKLNVAPGGLQPGDKSLQGIAIGPKGNASRIPGLHPKVFSLFSGMAKEFNTLTGKNVTVNESFRTYDDQMELRRLYPRKAAKPGNSIHEFGMALDINSPEANQLDEMGLLRKYGFTRPVGGETWHIEPAGVAVNPQAAKANPQHREEALDSSPGRGGGGYGATESTPLGKRNLPLQKKLFAQGSASTVDLSTLPKKDSDLPTMEGPATLPPTPPTSTPTPPTPTPAPPPQAAKTPDVSASPKSSQSTSTTTSPQTTPESSSVSKSSTESSLGKSGIDTAPASSLQASTKDSNANLDAGAIGTKNLSPIDAIKKASNLVGMNPETMVTFAKLESSLDPNAGAKTSSAKGLFQITKPTWNGLLTEQGPRYNIPKDADIFDPYYNSVMGISYAKENSKAVIPAGRQVGLTDEASLYLAHHFGPSGSERLIKAYASNPNQPTEKAVSIDSFKANKPALAGKTVGQYIQSLLGKMSTAAKTPETAYKGMKGVKTTQDTAAPSQSPTKPSTGSYAASTQPSQTPDSPKYKDGKLQLDAPPGVSGPAIPPPAIPPATTAKMQRTEVASAEREPTTYTPQRSSSQMPIPPQPSYTQKLDPNSEILNNQLTVLTDIKKILESFAGKAGQYNQQQPHPPAASPPPSRMTSAPEQVSAPQAQQAFAAAPMSRAPSSTSVSMSRRQLT